MIVKYYYVYIHKQDFHSRRRPDADAPLASSTHRAVIPLRPVHDGAPIYSRTRTQMNRQELVDAVAASTGDSKASVGATIDTIVDAVTAAVTRGETVQLIGFGSFSTGSRAERTGRNPATGQEMTIPAARTVKFTAGKAFKDAVNQ